MTKPYEFCLVEKKQHLWEVTINRPEMLNALHPPANFELESVFNDFASDDDAWVAILTGAGDKAFSTGNDLKYQASGKSLTFPDTGFAGLTKRFNLDKPIIAAVNGFAMGGGFEIALACDLIVADENASFSLPEPKVGLAALAGGIHRLPRQIGEKLAMELLFTGRNVSAEEAKQIGLINRICNAGEALGAARELADEILQCSPMSIQISKQMCRQGQQMADLETAINYRYDAFDRLINSHDFVEGPKAFAEKRKPRWSSK
ncbi:enoyl-CoA hydratase-related protein [Oceanicoccus sp. KOV_DT_Chl]|uniref:enoyl-CoA hydratase-related protein n=1 Tax=Oceanicoccus sp. KOV_DT_Chl TaxID=1904639 RepID=UPI000C7B9229|nr:enoyl-CoA hydratase-related protein [Oceanicoccus sp. KOV_DT_Chl]